VSQMPSENSATLRDVLFILFRQEKRILLFFVTVVVAVILATVLAPSVYQSEAKVLIRLGKESLADPTLSNDINPILSVGQSRDSDIASGIELMKSRELAAQVVDQFGHESFLSPRDAKIESGEKNPFLVAVDWFDDLLTPGDSPTGEQSAEEARREDAIEAFMENLEIEVGKQSTIITLTLDAYHPKLAHDALQFLLDAYIERHIEVYQASGSLQFFEEQAAALKTALEAEEDRLQQLKLEFGVTTFDEAQTLLMDRIDALKQSIDETLGNRAAASAALDSLRRNSAELPQLVAVQKKSGIPNLTANAMREDLFDLRIQEQRLLAKYEETSPPVKSIREEIAQAEALLKAEAETLTEDIDGTNTVYQDILSSTLKQQATLRGIDAQATALNEQLLQSMESLNQLIQTGLDARRMERNMGIQESNYRTYLDKMEQARINRELEIQQLSNISVVQSPTMTVDNVRPRRLLNVVMGFFLALFGGITFAFILEYLDDSFKKPDDVERELGVPVLAAIARPKGRGFFGKRISARQCGLHKGPGGWALPPAVREQYKGLSDAIIGPHSHDAPHRCLVVTSSAVGEGASTIATNLAFTLAASGSSRVLLIDAQISRPSLHETLGCPQSPGMVDLLNEKSGANDIVVSTDISGLDFVPAGKLSDELTYLSEARFFDKVDINEKINTWKSTYDYTIIDTPFVSPNASTLLLAEKADGVLWVVEAESTRKPVALYTQTLLQRAEANMLGVVFNKRQFHIPRWLYRFI